MQTAGSIDHGAIEVSCLPIGRRPDSPVRLDRGSQDVRQQASQSHRTCRGLASEVCRGRPSPWTEPAMPLVDLRTLCFLRDLRALRGKSSSWMPSVAVVPAAGRGERFGGMKLAAMLRGEPLIAHTLRCLLDGGVDAIVLVTAPDSQLVHLPAVSDPRISWVTNPDPSRGMFSSIQAGVAAAEGDPLLILPADMPFVRAETVRLVLAAATGDSRGISCLLATGPARSSDRSAGLASIRDSRSGEGATLASMYWRACGAATPDHRREMTPASCATWTSSAICHKAQR